MDFKKIHWRLFEKQLIRMTDCLPNFVFLSTNIGYVQLNKVTLSKNVSLSAAECLAYIWESDSWFLDLGCECFFLKFLIFVHLSYLRYLRSTVYIFCIPTLRGINGGCGKCFKQKQLSAICHGVLCQMFDKLPLGHRPSGCNGADYFSEEPAKHVATGSNSSVSFGQVSQTKVLGVVIPILTWSCQLIKLLKLSVPISHPMKQGSPIY